MRLATSTKNYVMHRMGAVLCGAVACLLITYGSALAVVALPDGRAWEMVSPPEKNGGEINGIDGVVPNEGLPEGGIVQSATNGGTITYLSLIAFPGSTGTEPLGAPLASQYLSTRDADGWSTTNLTVAMKSKTYPPAGSGAPYRAFSDDLSKAIMLRGAVRPVENPPLTNDAPPQYMNYYLRDGGTGEFSPFVTNALLTSLPTEGPASEGPAKFLLELEGVTPDLNHSVFGTRAALSSEATHEVEGNLYEWVNGQFQPVNVPPGAVNTGNTAGGGALLGNGFNESHTISDDGSRVFWTQPANSLLFVRENIGTKQATTVQIDRSQGGADAGGNGEFKIASLDGSRVYFTDEHRLTPDATAGNNGARQDLYLFNVENNSLIDLTVDGTDPGGAATLGVLGASNDGSYVYFVAEGVLPGSGVGLSGAGPFLRKDNVYVWHGGITRFLFTLAAGDSNNGSNHEPTVAHDWDKSASLRTTRVSADGRYLLFMSEAGLTTYDNRDANHPEKRDEEVYLYDDATGSLTCVSCNPSGARPIGPSGFPGGTPWRTVPEVGTYQPRVLSEDDNRVFFDSKDALVSQDTNGVQDVYEWEQDGTGSCVQADGCVYLLSGATSTSDSSFVDASASGDDAFFVTRAQLVGQDTDQLRDLYDARVDGGGGFAPPPTTPPACEGESCLPPSSSPPSLSSPISTTFIGAGNVVVSSTPVAKAKATKRSKAKKPKRRTGKGKKRKSHGAAVGRAHRSRKGGR